MVAGDGSPSAGSTGVAWKQLQEHASIFAFDQVVICMVTTRPPKTIVKPTALSPVANTDTKLLIYGLFQKGRVLAQDGHQRRPRRDERSSFSVFVSNLYFRGTRLRQRRERALTGRAASEKKPPERPRISSAAGRDDAALRDDAVIAKAMGYRVERKSFWMKSSRSASRHWAISISHARSAVTPFPPSGSRMSILTSRHHSDEIVIGRGVVG